MKKINLSEAKNRLSELVKETAETTEALTITVHGRKEVVLMSMEEYDSLMETIEIMQDKELMKRIAASMEEIKRGELIPWEKVKKRLHKIAKR